MWVRGLKHRKQRPDADLTRVAPHVGAWIETLRGSRILYHHTVAPHVGAWIETQLSDSEESLYQSHPMWVRGLKRRETEHKQQVPLVAPHVGAWIETK